MAKEKNDNSVDYMVEQVRKGKMTRRQLIAGATALGLGATVMGSMLAACGSD